MNYKKILVAYICGVMEAEGVPFEPIGELTAAEEIAWNEAVLEAGVNERGEKEHRKRIALLKTMDPDKPPDRLTYLEEKSAGLE